jgi:hypothetical protein
MTIDTFYHNIKFFWLQRLLREQGLLNVYCKIHGFFPFAASFKSHRNRVEAMVKLSDAVFRFDRRKGIETSTGDF